MEKRLAQPSFWMAALLVLLVLGIQVALAVPLGILNVVFEQALHQPPPQLERHPIVAGCINIVACGAAIVLGLRLNRLSFRRAFPFCRITALQLVGGGITILGATVLLSEADNALRALLPPPPWLRELFKDLFFSDNRLISQVFLLVIVVPVTEELLFRGIILRGLLSRFRPAVAVLLTALLFAALHMNPWQFLSAFFLGAVFGWFFLRTGSVTLCLLGHAASNGLFLVAQTLPVDIPGLTGRPDYTTLVFQPWWLDLSGLGVLLAGICILARATPQAAEEPIPPVISEPLPPPIITPGNPPPGTSSVHNSLPENKALPPSA